jgi:hypothetical protein
MVPIPEGSETHSEESSSPVNYGDMQEMLDQPGDLTGSGGSNVAAAEEEERLKDKKVAGACELSG